MLRDSSERESSRRCRSSSVTRASMSSNRPAARSRWRVEDERVDLVAQQRDLRAEGEDVLDGAVVEVEADPHEPLLAERTSSRSRSASARAGAHARDRRERGWPVAARYASARPTDSRRGPRPRRRRPEARTSPERSVRAREAQASTAPQRGLCGRPGPPALAPVPERQHDSTLPASCRHSEASLAIPSWSRSRSCISDATRGGSSCRSRAGAHGPVEIEPRSVERLAAHLGECLDRDLDVRVVELALGGQRHDDAPDVGAGRRAGRPPRSCPRRRTRRAPTGGP